MSVLIPAQNHLKLVLFVGIKMMMAGWVCWQPYLEQSQQNRTMPRYRPLSCDIIMKDGLTMKCCQIHFFAQRYVNIGWKEVCKLESLSNACVDPTEKSKCRASVGNQRHSCRAIARWAAIPIHCGSTLYCNAIAIAAEFNHPHPSIPA